MAQIYISADPAVSKKRVHIRGKFIYDGDEKLYIKGVTYGTFKPDEAGVQFPDPAVVRRDFAVMAKAGINSVRVYTVPPVYLLDIALNYHLKVMAGLPWEQHITFLDEEDRAKDILTRARQGVLSCKKHPAILCYAIGNEIPASIVRWYGKKKIERFLLELYHTVKRADGESLVTYVNYPTTEYLDVSFLDFDCFNVYLETAEKLSIYISKLHNLTGDRPLVLAEIGLDSLKNGHKAQAEVLSWQIETIFGKGCAGMFIFAWTDEWWRGGHEIEGWDFGLVDRARTVKPALHQVSEKFKTVPFDPRSKRLFISVVICSYNGSRTIGETLDQLLKLDYPDFEVIVVNDGSKDNLAAIVEKYPVRLITIPNRGLSNARNVGLNNAKGEIIAYLDDDAYPDAHWLHYLAYAYHTTSYAAIGGPNIAPGNDGNIAFCVANAPGGPVHVLLTDEIAEHVPGCNLSIRKSILLEIGGFDPIYHAAGDDVDICWRIQDAGYLIGFHPSAMVWHHRRNSLKAYWKQQEGYGKAEALLEAKWPQKYNGFGHLTWAGSIYGHGLTLPIKLKKDTVFYGSWGSALFQSVYEPAGSLVNSLPLMPEWYLIIILNALIALFGFLWSPLMWLWAVFLMSVAVVVIQAVNSAFRSKYLHAGKEIAFRLRLLIVALHLVQPMARLYGRFKHGLTPWRVRGAGLHSRFLFIKGFREFTYWSEQWHSPEEWLTIIEKRLIELKTRVSRGGDYDKWDLQVRNGLYSKCRGLLTVEEHGAGKQLLRFKCYAHYTMGAFVVPVLLIVIFIITALDHQWIINGIADLLLIVLFLRFLLENGSSMKSMFTAFQLLSVKELVELQKTVKEETVNAQLNESVHKKEALNNMVYNDGGNNLTAVY